MPRLQTMVMIMIPEEAMGAIGSAIGIVDIVLPSLLGMILVALATSLSISVMVVIASLVLLLSIYWMLRIKEFSA